MTVPQTPLPWRGESKKQYILWCHPIRQPKADSPPPDTTTINGWVGYKVTVEFPEKWGLHTNWVKCPRCGRGAKAYVYVSDKARRLVYEAVGCLLFLLVLLAVGCLPLCAVLFLLQSPDRLSVIVVSLISVLCFVAACVLIGFFIKECFQPDALEGGLWELVNPNDVTENLHHRFSEPDQSSIPQGSS